MRVRTKLQNASGVYMLKHQSGIFYIGSTEGFHGRWHAHKSLFKAGRNSPGIQKIYDMTEDISEWQMRILEVCTKNRLKKVENKYLQKYKTDPNCLNIKKDSGNIGRRGLKLSEQASNNTAKALLGKNSKDKIIRRPKNLTFVSPDGKEYPNIVSVKRFAEEMNVPQPLLNYVANGVLAQTHGWTLKNVDFRKIRIGDVLPFWDEERLAKHFDYDVVIGPDNTEYKVFSRWAFEVTHKCKIITRSTDVGCSKKARGLTKDGRGYRLASVPTFTLTYKNKTYTNVVSLSKLCQSIGLGYHRVVRALRTPVKNKRQFEVRKNVL